MSSKTCDRCAWKGPKDISEFGVMKNGKVHKVCKVCTERVNKYECNALCKCECGAMVRRYDMKKHQATKKCRDKTRIIQQRLQLLEIKKEFQAEVEDVCKDSFIEYLGITEDDDE